MSAYFNIGALSHGQSRAIGVIGSKHASKWPDVPIIAQIAVRGHES
jgi:hypothetical protein